MCCLIVRTVTPSVAQGRETKVLLQSELVLLSPSSIGVRSTGGTFMCKSAGVHWHAPVLHIFATWTQIFSGYQVAREFRYCKMRTIELILPSLSIFVPLLIKNQMWKYILNICVLAMVLCWDKCQFLLFMEFFQVFQATVCSQFAAHRAAVVLRGPTPVLNGSLESGQFVTS